jgi:DNA-binding FrmR family transcriptional regulator
MPHSHKNHANRDKTITNFKKAQSHIARIQKMLDEDAYCVDIMQQNLAVIGLLKSAHQMLMEDHLHSCFDKAMQSNDDAKKAKMVEEILTVTKLLNK